MHWGEPGWLILLALVPLPWMAARARPRVAWPSLQGFGSSPMHGAWLLGRVPVALRGLAIACMAVALARPQTVAGRTRIAGRGVAIVVALDQSSSMSEVDLSAGQAPPSRLEVAETTLARFVSGRPDDLIGLVVFANYPDHAVLPTLDHGLVLETVRSIRPARPGEDGTNLGDAIAWSLDALVAATPKKKVLILLTDGRNSPAVPHPLDPEDAAALARDLGVTLHTIAVGREGGVVHAVDPDTRMPLARQMDGPDFMRLERLARVGGGRAFKTSDARALDQAFQTIDTLEKSPVRGTVWTRYREWYAPWVGSALALLALDRIMSAGRLRRLP
ncbi:MAG: VWA domain-containing protein [Planctomycetaceae bacterium]|nr:VWA domain-containing protein [Planctomycetaceae bacterium]